MTEKELVELEPQGTPIGNFQKERTEAISEMFDHPDESGIYPTSKFFARLDDCVNGLLKAQAEEIKRELDGLIIGINGCEFEERLDGDKGCIVLDMNENQYQDFWSKILRRDRE